MKADPWDVTNGCSHLHRCQTRVIVSLEYIPPAEEALELPVDELGMRLLRLIHEENQGQLLNRHNAALVGHWEHHPGGTSPEFLQAIAEAWDWLATKLLVARRPGDSGEWAFITRRGERALAAKDALAVIRAEERIDVDLHPRIARRVRRQFLLGEYELAALAAMREVEIRVRKLSKAEEGDIGVNLMKAAFKPD
jgi:hypothetical protein